MEIVLIFLCSFLIALVSVVGIVFFGEKNHLRSTHRFIVPFAVGTLLAISFFELIPETLSMNPDYGPWAILAGFFSFYLLSNVLYMYHHASVYVPEGDTSATKASALLLLWGDFVQNITDGVVIATSFFVNPAVGIVSAIAVALHEIPQEIAEFGVLRSAGYAPLKAALLNLISASGIFIGAGATVLLLTLFEPLLWMFLGIAAGNILYVAASDLLPGIRSESKAQGSFIGPFISSLLGACVMGSVVMYTQSLLVSNEEANFYGQDIDTQRIIEEQYGLQEAMSEDS